MKACFLVLLQVAFVTSASAFIKLSNITDYYEEHFNKTFECVRSVMAAGSLEHGLPSFSPFIHNKSVNVVTDNDYLRLNVVLDQVVIDGLTDYRVIRLHLEPDLTMRVDFVFPKLTMNSTYSGKANILGLYAVYGDGKLGFEIDNLIASTTIKHNLVSPLISSVDTTMKVQSVKVTITELMDDVDFSKAFSTISSLVSTWYVNTFPKNVSNYFNPKCEQLVSGAIGDFNFLDYLAQVLEYSCTG